MAKKAAKAPAAKAMTKTETLNQLAERSGLEKKEVTAVLDAMNELIDEELSKKGPGVFNIPGLLKLKVVDKPAVPARKGINPFTKEEQMFKAKPASRKVKATPLKALKDKVDG